MPPWPQMQLHSETSSATFLAQKRIPVRQEPIPVTAWTEQPDASARSRMDPFHGGLVTAQISERMKAGLFMLGTGAVATTMISVIAARKFRLVRKRNAAHRTGSGSRRIRHANFAASTRADGGLMFGHASRFMP